tara:strand:+ start:26875 stop:29088 length:2214 start_codon:yes stop_codon:yes gene_type:complete
MAYKGVVIVGSALSALDSALIDESWFENFDIPDNALGLRKVELNDIVYILTDDADETSAFVVADAVIFSPEISSIALLSRIARVGMRQFDRNISLPIAWQPYREGSLLSIYAAPSRRPGGPRLHFDQSPQGDNTNLFVFAVTSETQGFNGLNISYTVYERAKEGFLDALVKDDKERTSTVGEYGILLLMPKKLDLSSSGTLQEWYQYKLNKEQLAFVEKDYSAPVRLRGAAGTGKTQAMAVKCLRDLYEDADGENQKRFAFLTHSSALAHDVLRQTFHALDPTERWASLQTVDGKPKLWVGTLYELARELLSYEKKGLTPLSSDGMEGREIQAMLIRDAIKEIRLHPRFVLTLRKQCESLLEIFDDDDPPDTLIQEIGNEFACILDAEKIRKGTTEAARYVTTTRERWQMELKTEADRKLLLELHEKYRQALRAENFLSMDQMISDFERYLVLHEWDQLRDSVGFDAIFVDEYHYFNRVEAMVFHNLFATRARVDGKWPLLMAYDLKQSTSDNALNVGGKRFRNPGIGPSEQVDLEKVYRSTPEIVELLAGLDASFPALDLEGEFREYSGNSSRESGPVPELWEFETDIEMIDSVLEEANRRANALDGGGRQVAVLCMNEERFKTYMMASRVKDKVVTVVSRDDMRELRYAKKRCVLSMPEYVAGLQFDSVFLVNLDDADWSVDGMGIGAKRRYISRVYLGASRAAQELVIATTNERSGVSKILEGPLVDHKIVRPE